MLIKKQAWNSYAQQDSSKALVDLSSYLMENIFNTPFNFGQYTFDLTNLNEKKTKGLISIVQIKEQWPIKLTINISKICVRLL